MDSNYILDIIFLNLINIYSPPSTDGFAHSIKAVLPHSASKPFLLPIPVPRFTHRNPVSNFLSRNIFRTLLPVSKYNQ